MGENYNSDQINIFTDVNIPQNNIFLYKYAHTVQYPHSHKTISKIGNYESLVYQYLNSQSYNKTGAINLADNQRLLI